jgi:ABC-type Zn uptake system ZnuABC Zn-binding protein ZnuA
MAAVFLAMACAACRNSAPADSGNPIVVSTIFAYYDAARAIGGDKVDARILLPAHKSPHDYQSTLDDKAVMSKASLFIMNGLGLDDRFVPLLGDSSATKLVISDAVPPADILQTEEVSLGEARTAQEKKAALGNPHIWLDPAVQMKAAEAIRDALIKMDPADKATFEANAEKYQASLHALDNQFQEAVKTFKTRDFIGFHSAYEYLAHRYGLHQVASIEEIPDAGLSMAQTQKILQIIKDKNIHYIAVESALNGKAADKIKEEGHVQTITLQPLETYDDASDTYVSLMQQNLAALKTALNP